MRREFKVPALAAVALLAGCGGGDGDSAPPPVTVTPPTGGTPTPTPTPPGPLPARFLVAAAGAMPSVVWLDADGDGIFGSERDILANTSLGGEFGQGIPPLKAQPASGTLPSAPLYPMQARGVDAVSGLVFSGMSAPAGATVISPLSSLVFALGNEAGVRSALGLDSGAEALSPSLGLLTFDPVAGRRSADPAVVRDAARITSLNLQLLAVAAFAKDTNGDPVDTGVSLVDGSRYLAEVIRATGSARLSDRAVIRQILDRTRYRFGSPPDQLDAMASLLAKYFAVLPARIDDERTARGWALAFRFLVLAEMKTLSSQWPNPAAARIAALTGAEIEAAARFYAAAPAPMLGELVAVPDYRELHSETNLPFQIVAGGCGAQLQQPSCNDYEMHGGFGYAKRIISVAAGEPGTIEVFVDAAGETVTVRRLGAYVGTTWFTYTAVLPGGASATGRTYVRVKDVR